MKRKIKKILTSFLCVSVCVTLNINPLAQISLAVVESGFVDGMVNLKNNLIYIAQNGVDSAFAATESQLGGGTSQPSFNVTCDCDFDSSEIINGILGMNGQASAGTLNQQLASVNSNINSSTSDIINELGLTEDSINANIDAAEETVKQELVAIQGLIGYEEGGNIETDFQTIIDMLGYDPSIKGSSGSVAKDLVDIKTKLDEINESIKDISHRYRVAHLYSLNNMFNGVLWRPYSSDVPYVKDFATVTGKFANVYTGYWDTAVTSVYSSGKWQSDNEMEPVSLRAERALEVLGYDALVRSEGIYLNDVAIDTFVDTAVDGFSGQSVMYQQGNIKRDEDGLPILDQSVVPTHTVATYTRKLIPKEEITWLDAVTVLYKALGQYEYTYQSFMSYNPSITPETSPVSQGLSNITDFEGYDYYTFVTRNNIIRNSTNKESESKTEEYNVYWQRAINERLVPNLDYIDKPILASDFFILASDMMQIYGEPEINNDEMKALLQVYGSEYPIQLGTDIADAWAYLKIRGCLNIDIDYTDYVSREQLLDICMCIADEDSRSDYKVIEVVLDLSDLFKDDGYYPVYDLNYSVGAMSSSIVIDYTQTTNYTYLLPITENVHLGSIGIGMVFEEPKNGSNIITGASIGRIVTIDGIDFYPVSVPKTWSKNFYVGFMETSGTIGNGSVAYIEVPSDSLGGGVYKRYNIKDGIATVDISNDGWMSFKDRSADSAMVYYTDYVRAGLKDRPVGTQVASNATSIEKLNYILAQLTEPMVAQAAPVSLLDMDAANGVSAEIKIPDNTSSYRNDNAEEHPNYKEYYSKKKNGNIITSYNNQEDIFNTYIAGHCWGNESKTMTIQGNTVDYAGDKAFVRHVSFSSPQAQLTRLVKLTEFDKLREYMIDNDYGLYNVLDILVDSSGGGELAAEKSKLIGLLYNTDPVTTKVGNTQIVSSYNSSIFQILAAVSPVKQMFGNTWEDEFGTVDKMEFDDSTYVSTSGGVTTEFMKYLKDNYKLGASMSQNKINLLSREHNKFIRKWLLEYDAKAQSGALGNFTVIANDPNAILADLGLINKKLSEDNEASGPVSGGASELDQGGTTTDGISLSSSVNTQSIMNRNEQILIKWQDLLDAGFVIGETNGGQPTLTEYGTYEFMTKHGLVKVNDNKHTIQIGTVLYDLLDENGNADRLVYIDTSEAGVSEIYFDYRCVMGHINVAINESETKTELLKNHIGAGDYVVYDFGSNGAESSQFTTKDVLLFNYPEVPGASLVTEAAGSTGYYVGIIGETILDNDLKSDGVTPYWPNFKASRMPLASFVPNANWVSVIDYNTGSPHGYLFVYYPMSAFELGFDDDGDGTKEYVSEPVGSDYRWGDLYTRLSNNAVKDSNGNTISSILSRVYGWDLSEQGIQNLQWYQKMTVDAVSTLYELTGKYYLDKHYAVRVFDLNDCSINQSFGWNMSESNDGGNVSYSYNEISSGDDGALYWIDTIGFVYNIPSVSDFTLGDYLSGKYPLPLAVNSGELKDGLCIINYNLNEFNSANTLFREEYDTLGEELSYDKTYIPVPYGYVLTDDGYTHYKTRSVLISDGVTLSADVLPKRGDLLFSGTVLAENLYPYNIGTESNCFYPAPSAVYHFFSGNNRDYITSNSLSRYFTETNKVFYGSSQLSLSSSSTMSSSHSFDFISKKYNPVAISSSSDEAQFQRVHRTESFSTYVFVGNGMHRGGADSVAEVIIDDTNPNPLNNLLDGLGANSLINAIDEGSSMLIILSFQVLPIIGVILMMVLVGISFMTESRLFRMFCEKVIDPVKILTFGARDATQWHWRKVLVPCTLLFIVFALFMNANLIRIVSWVAEWYGVVSAWFMSR